MWDWFVNFLTQVLAWLAQTSGDWGLAVIILTFIIRILIMPLMNKSAASTARMQVLQPKLMEIQNKYADDPERQMQEMRKFQAEHDFNPLGGCLPMILQMPVFFALFTVARNVPADAHFLNILPSISMSVSQAIAQFGMAGAWVYIVFDTAGISDYSGSAAYFYNTWCFSSDRSQLRPGMIIAVNNTGGSAAGRMYGHIGIYLGNNTVRHFTRGQVFDMSLDDWCRSYGSVCTPRWGWNGGVVLS